MGLLDEVRANAARLAEAARFVHIEHQRLQSYAAELRRHELKTPELDKQTHFIREDEPEKTLAYVVILDAINFGSGYFPHLNKRRGMSGYFTVASSLKDWFEANGAPSTETLEHITQEDCARIFGQLPDNAVAMELMGLFAEALNQLGSDLNSKDRGSFTYLVKNAEHSAERLAERLAEMPFYRDTGFYKRAQLTAADLAAAEVASFGDLDQLTIFADNLVPHVLRVDGVLRYQPELLERINREELIPSGSREELEIRGCALHAVELLKPDAGKPAMQLDYLLWNRGQRPEYKAQPRHRTRTVFY